MGPEMMAEFRRQAERFGADFVTDDVTRVDFSEQPFRVWVEDDEYRAKAVIVATGASARWLGLPGEQHYQGRGVSACATCDGAFFQDKELIVVGGGDTAMEEATFLTRFATKVTRRAPARRVPGVADHARPRTRERQDRVRHERRRRRDPRRRQGRSGAPARHARPARRGSRPVDGVFVAIGHDPNTKLFVDQLDHDEAGYLVTKPGTTETNVRGVFAAGDVQDHTYRQAVTAAGSGCMAALDAERFLAEEEGHAGTALTAPRPEAAEV